MSVASDVDGPPGPSQAQYWVLFDDLFPPDAVTGFGLVFTNSWCRVFPVFTQCPVQGPCCFTDALFPTVAAWNTALLFFSQGKSSVPAEIIKCLMVCGKCCSRAPCELKTLAGSSEEGVGYTHPAGFVFFSCSLKVKTVNKYMYVLL